MANEVDEFLNGLDNQPKDDPFVPETKDPLNQPKEEAKDDKEDKEDKPLPFHKDPKVQRFIEKEVAKRISEIKIPEPQYIEREEKEETPDVIGALETIIGNDTPEKVRALKSFEKALKDVEENAVRRTRQESIADREAEAEEEAAAFEELQSGFESIEETYDVDLTSQSPAAKKTRNEFVDFITRIAPKDQYGQVKEYPDFEEAFSAFQKSNKADAPSNARAKELAARGMQRSGEAPVTPATTDKSWRTVDKIFGKLFG